MSHANVYIVMIVPTNTGKRVIAVVERSGAIGLPGGGNDKKGETPRQAAMREFREEAGVEYSSFNVISEKEIVHHHKNGSTTLGILAVCSKYVHVNSDHRFIEKHGNHDFVETQGVMLPRVSEIYKALTTDNGYFHCNFANKWIKKPVCPVKKSVQWRLRECISAHPHPKLVAFLAQHAD